MAQKKKKNMWLPADLLAALGDYIEHAATEGGVTLRESDVIAAGIVAFLEADAPTRTHLLQRAAGYHFDKLAELGAAARRGETARGGKKLKRK